MKKQIAEGDNVKAVIAKLIAKKKAMESGKVPVAEPIKDHVADEMTAASLSAIQTTSFAIQWKKRNAIERIDGAIQRCERGIYGLCTDCDEEISKARLLAVPEAEFCIACQREQEHQEKLEKRDDPRGMDTPESVVDAYQEYFWRWNNEG